MGIKRNLANFAEGALGAKIMRPNRMWAAFEEVHLKNFFAHFQVDCVFDVGANAGQYAGLLRERVGFKGPIVSFEPIPDMARMLREKAQQDPDWHIEELALTNAEGEAVFHLMAGDQFSSLLMPKHSEYGQFAAKNKVASTVSVKTSTLKTEYQKYKKKLGFERPFLKMDTQGNDMIVVQSAGEIISGFVGLQSELAVKRIYENAPYYHEAITFYQSKGFELSAFVPNNEGHFPHLVEIDCIMFRGDLAK